MIISSISLNHLHQVQNLLKSSNPLKKLAFIAFLDSTSTDSTNNQLRYATCISKNMNSIANEFVLYKSIGNKEVEKVVREELNPDASAFR